MSGLRFVLAMAWRESRASPRRLSLLVASVAIGVGALVAINSFTDNVQTSVRGQARALLGADLALVSGTRFSPKAEAILAELAREAGVGRSPEARLARGVSFGAMAYVPRTAGSRLIQLVAVEGGYPFYGAIETSPAGEWERLSSSAGALVDGALLTALDAQVGDTLALGEGRFVIRGIVLNVPGDVGVRTALGPRVFLSAGLVEETRLLGFGSRGRYEAFLKLPSAVRAEPLAERYRVRLGSERVTIRTVSEDQQNLNDTLGRMGRFLGLVGLVALLLGGLGVASAVHVFIQRKTETLAVLRCLGATQGTLLAIYLTQAAAMGLAGSLLGAALGIALQRVLPLVVADFLPVDVRVEASWGSLAAGLGMGLWVAMLFALLPLLGIREVSPMRVFRKDYEPAAGAGRDLRRWLARTALLASGGLLAVLQADSVPVGLAFAGGIGVALGALWLAALGLVRGIRRYAPSRLPYLWRQGLANLHRPANQTLTVVLALGFGAFLLDTLFLVQHNLLRAFRLDSAGARANVVLFDIQPDQRAGLERLVREEGFAVQPPVPIVPMRIVSLKGKDLSSILAADPPRGKTLSKRWAFRREYRSTYRDVMVPSERLVEGKPWAPGSWRGHEAGEGAPVPISLDAGIAKELGVGLGDAIGWDVQGVPVSSTIATLRDIDFRRFEPNFFVVFPEGTLDAAPQMFVTLTRVDDAGVRSRLQRKILEAFPNVTVIDLSQIQRAVEQIVDRVTLAIRFMALFSLATGAVVLLGAVAAGRHQRMREGVLLKTLGATRQQVSRILLAEYLSLGTLAAVSAFLLSTAAGWALHRFRFETSFAVPLPAMTGLALAVVALTVAVGLWSSWDVARRPPLEVLRAE